MLHFTYHRWLMSLFLLMVFSCHWGCEEEQAEPENVEDDLPVIPGTFYHTIHGLALEFSTDTITIDFRIYSAETDTLTLARDTESVGFFIFAGEIFVTDSGTLILDTVAAERITGKFLVTGTNAENTSKKTIAGRFSIEADEGITTSYCLISKVATGGYIREIDYDRHGRINFVTDHYPTGDKTYFFFWNEDKIRLRLARDGSSAEVLWYQYGLSIYVGGATYKITEDFRISQEHIPMFSTYWGYQDGLLVTRTTKLSDPPHFLTYEMKVEGYSSADNVITANPSDISRIAKLYGLTGEILTEKTNVTRTSEWTSYADIGPTIETDSGRATFVYQEDGYPSHITRSKQHYSCRCWDEDRHEFDYSRLVLNHSSSVEYDIEYRNCANN